MRKTSWKHLAVFCLCLLALSGTGLYARHLWSQRLLTPSERELAEIFPNGALAVVEHPSSVTLYSLEPYSLDLPNEKGRKLFNGYTTLGQTQITEPSRRQFVTSIVYDGIARIDPHHARPLCFNPRHAIRYVQAKRTIDVVMCFECHQMQVFLDGKAQDMKLFPSFRRAALDEILKDANIPIAR